MAETYTGVIDRFEGNQAVVLLESGAEVVDEWVVDREELPEDGRHVDAVFHIEVEGGDVVELTYDEDETKHRKETAQERFDSLARRPPADDEDPD